MHEERYRQILTSIGHKDDQAILNALKLVAKEVAGEVSKLYVEKHALDEEKAHHGETMTNLYNDLIHAVKVSHGDESRHQKALRYIVQAQRPLIPTEGKSDSSEEFYNDH